MTEKDLPRDAMRRELRDIDRANSEAMAGSRAMLEAAFDDDGAMTATQRADMVLGDLARRRFLTVGGLSVAAAAVLAACGKKSARPPTPITGDSPSTSAFPTRVISDVVLLRTASSLEHNAIAVYDTVAGQLSGAGGDLAKLFADHHRAHAEALQKATKDLGGEPYTQPNPVVDAAIIQPGIAAAKSATEILAFAHALESVAAHTYQLVVPQLSVPALRKTAMSIGAVEARHAALLAKALGAAPVAGLDKLPGATPTTTTTAAPAVKGAAPAATVEKPVYFQVPGAFEPLLATKVLLTGTGEKPVLLAIDPLGPNSYMY